jgi:anaerobic selenocysteine-containing dehydrogenase
MFMEHDDIYQGGGHQYIQLGPKLIDPPGECWRNNHEVHARWPDASAPSIRVSR